MNELRALAPISALLLERAAALMLVGICSAGSLAIMFGLVPMADPHDPMNDFLLPFLLVMTTFAAATSYFVMRCPHELRVESSGLIVMRSIFGERRIAVEDIRRIDCDSESITVHFHDRTILLRPHYVGQRGVFYWIKDRNSAVDIDQSLLR